MCIRFESRKKCVAGNQCDDSDFDFHNAEHKELEKIVNNLNKKRLRLLWELLIAATILLIPSILLSRVTVNVLASCIFHVYL